MPCRIQDGACIKVTIGAFAGCIGTIIPKEKPSDSTGGLLTSPPDDTYAVLIEIDGSVCETCLDRGEIELISN